VPAIEDAGAWHSPPSYPDALGEAGNADENLRVDEQEEFPSWHRVAAHARFAIYGPTVPEPRSLWAGRFGSAPDHVGVMADIDGVEVAVETASRQRGLPAGLNQRSRIADALWHHLLAEESEIELPMQLEIAPEDRTVTVAGTATPFTGMRVVGSARWSGSATIGDVVVTITTTDPARIAAIEPIESIDLPRLPPGDLVE
jgi:hypothetical protein